HARLGGGPHSGRQPGHAAAQDQHVETSGRVSHGAFLLGQFEVGSRSIAVVDVHHDGRVALQLGLLVVGVGDDDYLVARLHETGGGAVEAHLAGAALDGIGLEPVAVVDVEHGDLLVLPDVGQVHEPAVERDRSDVLQVGVGHGGPVDLRLEHATAHYLATPWLSISRVRPTRAAISRRYSVSVSTTSA